MSDNTSNCCGATITNESSDSNSGSIVVDHAFINTITDVNGGNTTTVDGVNPLTTDTNLSAHIAATVAHGTTSAIVGINDGQTLTNKTILANANSIILDNISGSPNITGVINQRVRTTDGVTFGSVSANPGGVFAASGVQGGFGHFNTINSQAVDNTATINGVNPLTTDTNLNAHIAATTAHGTTSTIVGINDSQRLTAKNLAVPSCRLVDNSDATKTLTVNLIGASTGTTTTLVANQTTNRGLTLPDANDTLTGRATTDTLSNKTIDSGSNTITLTNIFLTAIDINNLIGQAVRSIDSPTFAAITTATITGNVNLALNANQIVATVNQPASMILNNTSTTFSNELRIQNNGTTIIGFGNNNSTNEAFCWTYANQPLKFATNNAERLRIAATGIGNDNSITSILGLSGTTLAFKNNIADTSTAQTFTNKNLSDSTTAIVDVGDATKRILFDAGGTTATSTTLTCAQTANRVITFPDATTTVVGNDVSQTLTNKTINSASNTLTITSSPLSAVNINSLINQDVRTSAGPTFTTAVNLTQSGDSTFAILTKADYSYSSANGSYFSSAVIGDVNLRNQDNTKKLNLGVGTGVAQLQIANTDVSYTTASFSAFSGSTKIESRFPITGSSAAGATTTLLTIPVPTNTSISIYLTLSTRKLTGTITGWGDYDYSFKAINNSGTVTANNSNNQNKSESAVSGAFGGKTTPSVAVSTTNVNVNLANTFADGTLVWAGDIFVVFS